MCHGKLHVRPRHRFKTGSTPPVLLPGVSKDLPQHVKSLAANRGQQSLLV
jgi:hypothetical protein